MSIFEQKESAVRSYCRNFTGVFETAKGSVLTYFLGRPICLVLIALIVISLLIPAVKSFRKAK